MARVTKINVGGTNYDIAHEGELKNSGFEVVTALPTTGLFAGREVMYNGKKYVYSSGWKEEITANTMYEANLLWGGRNIQSNASPIDVCLNPNLGNNIFGFFPAENIVIERSEDSGQTWSSSEISDGKKILLFTKNTQLTVGNDIVRITLDCHNILYGTLMKIIISMATGLAEDCYCRVQGLTYYKSANGLTGDTDYVNIAESRLIGWTNDNTINFSPVTVGYRTMTDSDRHYRYLRFIFGSRSGHNLYMIRSIYGYTQQTYSAASEFQKTGKLYTYDEYKNAYFSSSVVSKEVINFDVNNIEPTQTGSSVTKTSTWLWQYLVQGVNWLKANNVRLSAYNTKVASLEQADTDNNASTQSVRTDLTELSNGLAAVATSGSYNDLIDKPTFSGSYNDLTDKPTLFSGSYDDLTDKPTLFSGSYNDLTDKPTLATVATSGNYDDLLNTPALVFQNIGGTISSVQIPDGLIANAKLANPSMSLNGTTVNLGDTAILPWYVDYNEVDYPARIRDNWLQIYRNEVWANLMYLGDILPTQVGQITSLDNLDWYNEQVSEYEVDSNTTTFILNGTIKPATLLFNCTAEQLTLNLYPISGKEYGKGSLDSLISDLQGKGFAVFVENDLDTILQSGSDYLVRIKISKVPTPKAIIECYVAK